jgi:lipopolysaccharide biosynthesis regulator YciM
LALAVVLGAVGGRSQARARAAAESERLASAYVQSLDARGMTMP